jgi:predicted nucleic acid-binding protein
MPSKEVRQKYYYDACTLDLLETYREIINGKNSHDAVVSHLALGEAYGNTLSKKDSAKLAVFLDIIRELNSQSLIKIVGNDGIEEIVTDIQNVKERIDITDAVHFATAVREGCRVFKTSDGDFSGAPKPFQDVAQKHGLQNFEISEVHLPNSKYSKKHSKKTRS